MSLTKKVFILLGDVAVLHAALFLTLLIRYRAGFLDNFGNHILPFYTVWAAWLLVFYLTDLYRFHVLRNRGEIMRRLVAALSISLVISVILFYLFGNFFRLTPKTNLLIFTAFSFGLLVMWRFFIFAAMIGEKIRLAFFGESPVMDEAEKYIAENPQLGYEVMARVNSLQDFSPKNFVQNIKDKNITLIAAEPHFLKNQGFLRMVYNLLPLRVRFQDFLDFYESVFEKEPLAGVREEWLIKNISAERPYYDKAKNVFDLVFGWVMVIILSPFFILVGFLVLISSRGPIIFNQDRVGQNGKIFRLHKFRTMYHASGGPLWTEENDRRLTPIGRIFRATHLDELPQIINILKGDISFIGPRPERVELAEKYAEALKYYEVRHIIKPGLTGWAQINFRPSTSVEEAYEKLCYDVYYIKNRSFLLDIFVLIKTIKYIFVQPK